MYEKEDLYPDKEKYYVIEYDNGESYEDNWNYTLDVVFKSLDNAKEFVREIYDDVDPEDYDDNLKGSLPKYLYYTKESVGYNGEPIFTLEEDPYEDSCYSHWERNSSYTIREVSLLD